MPRRGRHPRNRLTDLTVRQSTRGRHADGNGLYLLVRPTGTRSWVQRIVIHGRRRDLGLGAYPLVTLREARRLAFDNRRAARRGEDPTAAGAQETAPTVRTVVEVVIAARRTNWRDASTEKKWRRLFDTLVFPRIGDKPISRVTLDDVRDIIVPPWNGRGSMGYVLRQHLDHVFQWAIAARYRPDNPASQIKVLLPKGRHAVKHHPSLPYRRVAAAMAAAQASDVDPAVKLLLLFLVLCASRFGEAAGAAWSEIDLEARLWIVPAERVKAYREHRVPLPSQACDLLQRMRTLDRPGPLVFTAPSRDGSLQPVAASVLARFLDTLELVDDKGRGVVPHGFRSTFRVWAAEQAQASFEVSEAALGHIQSNPTVAAYARGDFCEARRPLMQRWADHVVPPAGRATSAPQRTIREAHSVPQSLSAGGFEPTGPNLPRPL